MEKETTQSAGFVPIRWDEKQEQWKFLLLRCFSIWEFPKGRVEKEETLLTAALREAKEEANLNDLKMNWGDEYRSTHPYSRNKVAHYFLGETENSEITLPINPLLGKAEHQDFKWCTIEEARFLLPERLLSILEWAQCKIDKGPIRI